MKLNKILLFLILFFSFTYSVKAQISTSNVGISIEEDDELKYDVEEMIVEGSKIILNGWARKEATVTGDHNIGGENLNIYIAVVSQNNVDDNGVITTGEDGFKKNIKEIKDKIEEDNIDLNSDYNYLVKKTQSYDYHLKSGDEYKSIPGNRLYGSLCVKNCDGKCCEYPRSELTKPIASKKMASCIDPLNNSSSACESYNTNFTVSFDIKDLMTELGGFNLENEVNVEFLIFIKHFPVNDITFNSKYSFSEGKSSVYVRKLAISKTVCQGCESLEKALGLSLNMANEFKVQGHLYLVTDIVREESNKYEDCQPSAELGYKRCTINRNHFQNGGTYTIEDSEIGSRKETCATGGGILSLRECTINMYKLKVNEELGTYNTDCKKAGKCGENGKVGEIKICNGSDCKIYSPGENNSYWAWSTWGTVVGSTVLTFSPAPEINNNCYDGEVTFECKSGKYTNDECSYYKRAEIEDKTGNLNFTDVNDMKGKIIVYKEYKVNENISVVPNYNNNNNITDSEYKIKVKKGRFFNFNFELIDEITLTDNNKYYYYIQYVSFVDGEAKLSSEIPIQESIAKLFLGDELDISNLTFNDFSNEDLEKDNVSYDFLFDSNDGTYKNSEYNMKSSVSTSTEGTITKTIKIGIKKACINKNTSFVRYTDNGNCYDYEIESEKDNSYFVPFDFSNPEKLPSLQFSLYNVIRNNSIKYNFCNFEVSDLDYKYRVIDLKDPFPNYEPGIDGRASNWSELWNNKSSKTFLYDRRYDNNAERYVANLNSFNIEEVRKYNKSNKIYLNSIVSNNGESEYMKNNSIFSSDYVYKYKVGTKEESS